MIPKLAHYIWLGGGKKPENFVLCYESWQKYLDTHSGWKIREWGEGDIQQLDLPEYYHKALQEKKWAFASDVARIAILQKYGGVYLDTDMLLYKNIDQLLTCDFFSGYEDEINIACGIMGSVPNQSIIQKMSDWYAQSTTMKAIPLVMTEMITAQDRENKAIYIASASVFYSYPKTRPCDPRDFYPSNDALAIHLWDYAWETKTKKVLKKIPGFMLMKNKLQDLGLLPYIKKLLRQI